MKFIIILVSALILFSAVMCYSCSWPSVNYEKVADKITARTAKKLKQEKGLILIGTGGGMMNDIKMMMMGFNYYKVIDMDEARKLLIYCVEEYLNAINSDEKVRPYLHNYPFTAENIEIKIFFYKPDGSNVAPNEISVATANEGRMAYSIDDPEKHTLKRIHRESYEEALKIVSSQKECNQK